MKFKILSIFFLIVLLAGVNSCRKFTSNAIGLLGSDSISSTVFPAPLGTVSDFEEILTAEQIRSLDSIIILHERRKNNKISIVSVKSIKPYETLNEYSTDLLNSWKQGDDGKHSVAISFSKKLNDIQIITGTGLRKKLTEKESKRIIQNSIQPEFEKGDYYLGLKKGLQKIITEIK